MHKNRKAESGAIRFGSVKKTNNFTGGDFDVFAFKYKENLRLNQCRKCGSDYMKYAVGGFCQNCVQKVEFITREFPKFIQRINRGAAK